MHRAMILILFVSRTCYVYICMYHSWARLNQEHATIMFTWMRLRFKLVYVKNTLLTLHAWAMILVLFVLRTWYGYIYMHHSLALILVWIKSRTCYNYVYMNGLRF